MPKNVTYSLDDQTAAVIDELAKAWSTTKSDVVRRAVVSLHGLAQVAFADAFAKLEVIRDRYDATEVMAWVSQSPDGEPEAHVLIDGDEPADLIPRVVVAGESAFLFLDLIDGRAELLVPTTADDALLIRPSFPVGRLPWPPQNLRIVLSLKDLVAPTTQRLEAIEV